VRSPPSACSWSTTTSAPARFDALAQIPEDKLVVLGLVTTKTGRLETEQELEARIAEAARVIDLDRLALGTQCGFSTSVVGNRITAEDQRLKLELITRTAARAWPGD